MKKLASAALATALMATLPTIAAAKTKPNQRQIGDATASCVVSAEPARVRILLATLPGSPAETRAARRLEPTFNACSENAYRLTAGRRGAGLFNGRADLAAEMAVVAADTGRTPAGGGGAWYLTLAKAAPKDGYDQFLLGVQEFGACVVGADAGNALKLVRSAPGSHDEVEAVAAMRPTLGPCVVQGTKLNFTRDELRLAVAEPLYHALTGTPSPVAAR